MVCSHPSGLQLIRVSHQFSDVKGHHLLVLRLIDTDPDLVQARCQACQMVREHNLVPERFARPTRRTLHVGSALHAILLLGLFFLFHSLLNHTTQCDHCVSHTFASGTM